MPVPSSINDLDPTPSSNSPAGSESVFPDLDNHIRAGYAYTAQIHRGVNRPSWSGALRIPFFDGSGDYATSSTFRRSAAGNVGIGVSTPLYKIHLGGVGASDNWQFFEDASANAYAAFGIPAGGGVFAIQAIGTVQLAFMTNAKTRVQVDAEGNVAIKNTDAAPSTPASGGFVYVEGGALKYRGSSGTVTVLAPA